jgi:hypothetical protein
MSHRVIMVEPAVAPVPEEVRERARQRFQEIAEGLDGIPPDSPFWASVQVSRLCLVVSGWTFFYTLDEETLRVTEVRRSK